MALTREAILAQASKVETREVHVAAWADESGDDVVLVRGLTAKEWDAHQASQRSTIPDGKGGTIEVTNSSNLTAKLVCRCLVDADGKRLFTDADANALGDLPVDQMNTLAEAILDLSGLTPAAEAEVEGNSDAAESGNSSSE